MTALTLLSRYWREAAIGALILALTLTLLIGETRLTRCRAKTAEAVTALDKTKADYRQAQAAAALENVTQVRAIEQANAAVTQEIERDLTTELADARAAGAAYAVRLRDQADAARRAARAAGVPEQADTASSVDAAGGATLLADDIRICGDAVVKAEGWQRWWSEVK